MTYDPNAQQPPPPSGPMPPPGYMPTAYPPTAYPGYYPPMLPPPKPTSVVVISIIGIVLASLTLICTPFSLIAVYAQRSVTTTSTIYSTTGPVQTTSTSTFDPATAGGPLWLQITSSMIYLGLALLLLTASIGALRLRPWGRSLSITYAYLQILALVVGTLAQAILVWPRMFETMPDQTTRNFALVFAIIGGLIGILIALALPVCILIFYRRPKVIEAFRGAAVS